MRMVFVHGWGMDADTFRPLRQKLAIEDTFGVDLGFVNQARPRIPFKTHPFVAVGHSLGVMWLLAQEGLNLKGFVAINGFTRFSRADDFANGVDPRLIHRMQTGMTKDPATVIQDFRTRIGAPPINPECLNAGRASEGLGWLQSWDLRDAYHCLEVPTLILAGARDPIVPPAMTEACFDGFEGHSIEWADDGGHLLPQSHTLWCKTAIEHFLKDLS